MFKEFIVEPMLCMIEAVPGENMLTIQASAPPGIDRRLIGRTEPADRPA